MDYELFRHQLASIEMDLPRFATLLETIGRTIDYRFYIKDSRLRYVSVDRRLASALSLSPEEMIGKTDHDLFSHEVADSYAAEDREAMLARSALFFYRKRPGESGDRWFREFKAPLLGPDGRPEGVLGFLTERSQEKSLWSDRQRLADIVDHLPAAVVSFDSNLHITYLNRYAGDFLGYVDPSSLIGGSIETIYPEAEAEVIRKILTGGEESNLDRNWVSLLSKDGRELPAAHRFLGHEDPAYGVPSFTVVATPRRAQDRLSVLRSSIAREYRSLLDVGEFGVWSVTLGNERLELSENVQQLFGVERRSYRMIRDILPLIHPSDRQVIVDLMDRFAAGKEGSGEIDETVRILSGEDRVRWARIKGRRERDSQGRALNTVTGVVRDVTSEERTRSELLTDQRVLETSVAAVGITDGAGFITDVNARFLELWQFDSPAEVVGRHTKELWGDPHEAEEILSELERTGYWKGELKARRSDGTTFDVLLTASGHRNASGGTEQFIGTAVDISDRNRYADLAQYQAEMLEALKSTTQDGFWVVDGEGRIEEANRQGAEILGYTVAELQRLTVPDIDAEEDIAKVQERQKRIRERGSDTFEASHLRKDGQVIHVSVTVTYWEKADRYIVMTREITEKVELLEYMKRLNNEQTQLNEALTALLKSRLGVGDGAGGSDIPQIETHVMPLIERLRDEIPEDSRETLELLEQSLRFTPEVLDGPLSRLSARELEVARLIVRGKTSKEIGDRIGISPRSVEYYRQSLRHKLNIKHSAKRLRQELERLFVS